MIIAVAGPYSATTPEQRKINLDTLNASAARLLEMGHTPLVGINAALPVLVQAQVEDIYKAIMDISIAVVANCDALLLIAESRGANMERDLLLSKGRPIYYSLAEVPTITMP